MNPNAREREFRQHLKSIFGNSCYADDVIDVIANVQLGKWGEKEMAEYRERQRELYEQIKGEIADEPIPFEEQIIHSPAVFYPDSITGPTGTNGTTDNDKRDDSETGKANTPETGIQ